MWRPERTISCLGMFALACQALSQGTFGGGGPITEDDGAFVYRVPPISTGVDRNASSSLAIAEDVFFGGVNRVLTDLTFNYTSDYARAGGMVVTFYAEGGPNAQGLILPGAKLLERSLDVRAGASVANIGLGYSLANTLPDRVFVAVRFLNVPAGGTVSLTAQPSAPEIGSTRPGYLERTGPGDLDWASRPLTDDLGNPANFMLSIKAAVVPEPSLVAFGAAGVALLFLVHRRRASAQGGADAGPAKAR